MPWNESARRKYRSEAVVKSTDDENLLVHSRTGVRGLWGRLAFEEQLATKTVTAVGTNDDIGVEYFSRLESDGLSGDVNRDNLGVCPIFGSSFVAELVEEFSDVCEL